MRRDIPSLQEVRRLTLKKRDAWWTVLLVDPVATPLVRWTAKYTRVTPNLITWFALVVGLGAAACFAQGDWLWLVVGAVLYHLSFVLDCMDGKLARLTGNGSIFGAWLDYVFDRLRVLACAVALMGGQYARTGQLIYVWLALAVVFLDMLRYIDALEIFKIRHEMRKKIKARVREARKTVAAGGESSELAFMEDLLRQNPEADITQDRTEALTESDIEPEPESAVEESRTVGAVPTGAPEPLSATQEAEQEAPGSPVDTSSTASDGTDGPAAADTAIAADGARPGAEPTQQSEAEALPRPIPSAKVVDLHQEFRSRFPWYIRFRSFLLRHRVRTHLISGIEFQMAVFIVAPLVDTVAPLTIVMGALLLVFELAIIYKLLLSTRDFGRTIAALETPWIAPEARATPQESPAEATRAGQSVSDESASPDGHAEEKEPAVQTPHAVS